MSAISSLWLHLPGMGTEVEEFQSAFQWGSPWWWQFTPGQIYSGALDSGNTPTTTLRMGLVLGQRTADLMWTNYSATATDGSQIARGVLPYGLRMTNVLTGTAEAKFGQILVAGGLKAGGLIGLDNMAREQLRGRFFFDDNLPGIAWFPFKQFQNKTTNYVVTAADNGTLFTTTGGTGTNFTLPTLANGLFFGFANTVDQNLTVTSAAGNDINAFNDLQASSVAFSTGGAKIGGVFWVYSNPDATRWIVENHSAGANTITVA